MKNRNPPPSPAREAAFRALLDVEAGSFPEDVLESRTIGLDPRDRALAGALVYGVLRHRTRLDWTLDRFLTRPGKPLTPELRTILRQGLFQLMDLDRVPASAAVDEAVRLAKSSGSAWAAGLVNAVLRAATRAQTWPNPMDAPLSSADRLAIAYSHPRWLVDRWLMERGPDETEALLRANNEPAPLTLRVDPDRLGIEEAIRRLSGSARRVESTRFSPFGLNLWGAAGSVMNLPGYDEGWFSVQDEAAQLVGLLVRPRPGDWVLDGCAGRGGKAFHVAGLADGVQVIGLDPDAGRLALAARDKARLNRAGVHLVRGDIAAGPPFPSDFFHLVLVDAPCSNLGVIRRRPDVKWSKAADSPGRMAEIQKKLLAAASRLVRPGGRLIYAVCTVTPEETTVVIDDFWMNHLEFGVRPATLYLPESAKELVGPDGLIRTWPHQRGTDGFFAAVFERKPAKPPEWGGLSF
jgi:16S rRNA (cytosine967-C5)-methyltransferase